MKREGLEYETKTGIVTVYCRVSRGGGFGWRAGDGDAEEEKGLTEKEHVLSAVPRITHWVISGVEDHLLPIPLCPLSHLIFSSLF